MIEYRENGDIAVVDGFTFRKDKKTGYYLSGKSINGKRKRLHVYIWEKYNEPAEKGYHIHHKDGNKANNEIENLVILNGKEHSRIHGTELCTDEMKMKRHYNVMNKAIPAAVLWHKSESGRNWHKQHYEQTKDKFYAIERKECENCGKIYFGHFNGKFCSNNCKSAYRRKQGIDNETRICIQCGKEFVINRYSTAKTCCRECRSAYRRSKSSNV